MCATDVTCAPADIEILVYHILNSLQWGIFYTGFNYTTTHACFQFKESILKIHPYILANYHRI